MQVLPVHFSPVVGAKHVLRSGLGDSSAGPSVERAHLPLLMLVLIAAAAAALVYMLLLLASSASGLPKWGQANQCDKQDAHHASNLAALPMCSAVDAWLLQGWSASAALAQHSASLHLS